jgi:hypothetical protein
MAWSLLDPIEAAGYALHVVQGPSATPSQAMSLTERLREHGLHIEVWSLTMKLPGSSATARVEKSGRRRRCARVWCCLRGR